MIEFIFMLTHHDATVPDALTLLDELHDVGLRYVGFKDVGATPELQRDLTGAAHGLGMEVMLEVVSTTAEAELASLQAAVNAGVDWVLGGTHVEEGLRLLDGSGVRYCPFPGRIVGHPSVLEGSVEEIAMHAAALSALPGVHGVDLLAYRHHSVDPVALTRAVAEAVEGPVIAAGSVVAAHQIHALAEAGAWGFTIGGAIFEGLFPGAPDEVEQIRSILKIADGA
jgi:hypothetical protein